MDFKNEYKSARSKTFLAWFFSRALLIAVFFVLSGKIKLALVAWLGWEIYQWLSKVYEDNMRALKIYKKHIDGG